MENQRESFAFKFFAYLLACALGLFLCLIAFLFLMYFGAKICEATGTQKIVVASIGIGVYFLSIAISYLWIKLKNYADDCSNVTRKKMIIYSCLSGLLGPINIIFLLCSIWDAGEKRSLIIFSKAAAKQREREKRSRYYHRA